MDIEKMNKLREGGKKCAPGEAKKIITEFLEKDSEATYPAFMKVHHMDISDSYYYMIRKGLKKQPVVKKAAPKNKYNGDKKKAVEKFLNEHPEGTCGEFLAINKVPMTNRYFYVVRSRLMGKIPKIKRVRRNKPLTFSEIFVSPSDTDGNIDKMRLLRYFLIQYPEAIYADFRNKYEINFITNNLFYKLKNDMIAEGAIPRMVSQSYTIDLNT